MTARNTILKLALIVLLVLLAGCNNENYDAQAIALKETLNFAGIDADVNYKGQNVTVKYGQASEGSLDALMQWHYIFGAAHENMPKARGVKIVSVVDGQEVAETSVAMTDIKSYLKEEITAAEFRQKVNVEYLI